MPELTNSAPPDREPAAASLSDSRPPPHRVGRPRRGTEPARIDALMDAATRVFLSEGYAAATIDKVATEAGVSTRTIYERFKNKADLLAAVITRLVDKDMHSVLVTGHLDRLAPEEALTGIAGIIAGRMRDPDTSALIRIVASEAQRFPEFGAKMREISKERWSDAVAQYLKAQVARGVLTLSDPDRAARLFLQMICAELHECLLFGRAEAIAHLDITPHVRQAIQVFLYGAIARPEPAAPPPGSAP